ncbi:hypothetical protein E1267_41280 [Nonomuraea longispora]|uniref:Uncharacterized protein n=1 Tax=Nonomuraea longispora TaxID=1848320 RepID=A0A4R4MQ04_9ACTN|nr:hypothetical protein [Nonomuraea longispora]TDB96139.1 hypothetical protein E1267_41280 [Nonomuraea longispora]
MTPEGITWDVTGRESSARSFRTLTDEQQQVHEEFRGQVAGSAGPLPYPDFAGPYQEYLVALFGGSAEVVAQLGGTGEGQALMAARNTEAEAAAVREVGDDHDRRA